MKIAFYGSSLLSSWWNGAATYYRGLLRDLSGRGYDITFYEPDAFGRQEHRDIEPPAWAKSVVYPATDEGLRDVVARAGDADIVIKASDVGVHDDELVEGIVANAREGALKIYWDVDLESTLDSMRDNPDHPVRRNLRLFDLVLTRGGGPSIARSYEALGAAGCVSIYNALDPATSHPVDPNPRFDADLSFLGNRLPDREARVEEFLISAANLLPERKFLVGGNGWSDTLVPPNVRDIGYVAAGEHNAFNCTPLALLNVTRDCVAKIGFAPASRIFEAAGAAACLITDAWEGIELFLSPDQEVLVARDGKDVAQFIEALTPVTARTIGEAALRRVLSEHTYAHRGAQVDELLSRTIEAKAGVAPVAPAGVPAT